MIPNDIVILYIATILVLCPDRFSPSGSRCKLVEIHIQTLSTESELGALHYVSLVRDWRNPWKRGRKDCRSWKRCRTPGGHGPISWLRGALTWAHRHWNSKASIGPAWICTHCSTYTVWLWTWCFYGNSNSGSRCVSDPFCLFLRTLFLL